jgi:hypothetical protein
MGGDILYIIAAVLIIIWIVAFFGYNVTDFVHLLIGIAVLLILVRLISGRRL